MCCRPLERGRHEDAGPIVVQQVGKSWYCVALSLEARRRIILGDLHSTAQLFNYYPIENEGLAASKGCAVQYIDFPVLNPLRGPHLLASKLNIFFWISTLKFVIRLLYNTTATVSCSSLTAHSGSWSEPHHQHSICLSSQPKLPNSDAQVLSSPMTLSFGCSVFFSSMPPRCSQPFKHSV